MMDVIIRANIVRPIAIAIIILANTIGLGLIGKQFKLLTDCS